MELNKEYRRTGSVSNNVFIPTRIEVINDEEYVIFTNGGRCKVSTFNQDFVLNTSTNESMNINVGEDTAITAIDPDDFFKPKVDENLISSVEQHVTNPGTISNGPRPESRDLTNPHSQHNTPEPPAHMLNNHNRQPMNYDLHDRINNTNTGQQNIQQNIVNNNNRLPEHDIFDRVKSNSDLEIVIPFKLTIPKSQKIDTMDDMFESSFVDYLANKYINEVVTANLEKLETLIRNGINEWVEISLNSKKRKAVVKSEPFDIKKPEAKEKPETKEKPEVSNSSQEETTNVDITDQLRNPNYNSNSNSNLNLNEMYMINNNAEYEFVKAKYEELKTNTPDHPEIERLLDMLDSYDYISQDIPEVIEETNDEETNDDVAEEAEDTEDAEDAEDAENKEIQK